MAVPGDDSQTTTTGGRLKRVEAAAAEAFGPGRAEHGAG
jgi:hypothetical protein